MSSNTTSPTLTNAPRTPEELAKITGITRYTYKLTYDGARQCWACLTPGEVFFSSHDQKGQGTGHAVVCTECILRDGHRAIMQALAKSSADALEVDDEPELGALEWSAVIEQHRAGLVDLPTNITALELASQMAAAYRNRERQIESAMKYLTDGMSQRIGRLGESLGVMRKSVEELTVALSAGEVAKCCPVT